VKEPAWIEEREALALHDHLLALNGGAPGLRDGALLKSALARPQQHYAYGESRDSIHLAAVYTYGIVRNHPFVDGNKRTGFVVKILFLELNGYRFVASEDAAAAGRAGTGGRASGRSSLRCFSARQCDAAEEVAIPTKHPERIESCREYSPARPTVCRELQYRRM
jgi:death-on-curing protein